GRGRRRRRRPRPGGRRRLGEAAPRPDAQADRHRVHLGQRRGRRPAGPLPPRRLRGAGAGGDAAVRRQRPRH
ncbi:transcriptional regulator, partial [Streptomyces sp. NP160]